MPELQADVGEQGLSREPSVMLLGALGGLLDLRRLLAGQGRKAVLFEQGGDLLEEIGLVPGRGPAAASVAAV